MSRFSYKAVDSDGQHIAGTIDAADQKNAVVSLADNGQFVLELAEETYTAGVKGEKKETLDIANLFRFGSRRITGKDILAFTSQLSTALRAGLPLLNVLEIIREQQHNVVNAVF